MPRYNLKIDATKLTQTEKTRLAYLLDELKLNFSWEAVPEPAPRQSSGPRFRPGQRLMDGLRALDD